MRDDAVSQRRKARWISCEEPEPGGYSPVQRRAVPGDDPRQAIGQYRRRRVQHPGQMLVQSGQHARRRRKPGIQHVRTDDRADPVEMVELIADPLEGSAAVKAAGRGRERQPQLPIDGRFELPQGDGVAPDLFAQLCHRGGQQFIGHATRLDLPSERLQADAAIKTKHFAAANGDDAAAAVGLHPAKRRINEQGGDFAAAIAAAVTRHDREQTHLESVASKANGNSERATYLSTE